MSVTKGSMGPTRDIVSGHSEVLDAAFVVVLGAIGILGFSTTYGGDAYLIIGAVGLIFGVAISEATSRLRLPYVADIVITLFAFFLLGGAVALHVGNTASPIPTPGTLFTLADVGIRGWKELLTIRPPIGDTAGLLVIPYLIGLFGGMSGYSLARRTKLIALPVLAPLVILVISILFGTNQPAQLFVQGSVFGALVVLWWAVRSARKQGSGAGAKPWVRIGSVLAIVGAAAAAAPIVGPKLPFAGTHQRVVLSRFVIPPLSASDLSSPLGSFRNFTAGAPISLSHVVLFTVHGVNPGSLMRIATMDSYNGLVWGFGTPSAVGGVPGAGSQFFRYGSTIPPTVTGRQGTITVHVEHPIQAWLPDIGQATSVSFQGSSATQLAGSFFYNPLTGTAIDTSLGTSDITYRMQVIVPNTPSKSSLTSAAAGTDQLAVSVPTPLQTQAVQWVGNSTGAWDKVLRLASQLKTQGRFSNGTENPPLANPGHSAGRLEQFIAGGPLVGKQIVGDDEQFAATLALMSNAIGVPARVVFGAQVPPDGIVRGSDVHAWVEVSLAGLGWVQVDPSLFLPTLLPTPAKKQNQPVQAAQTPVAPPLSSILRPPPNALPPSQGLAQFASNPNKHSGFQIPGFVLVAAKFVGVPALMVAFVVGTIGGLKSRRRKLRRKVGSPALRVTAGWRELIDMARDLRFGVAANLTRREQATGLPIADAVGLAGKTDALVFGPRQPTSEEVEQYWLEVDASLRHMSTGVGRWRRIWGLVNISSLLGRGKAFP